MNKVISEGTSLGMRKWWATKPRCMNCKQVRIKNPIYSRLCAACRRASQEAKNVPIWDDIAIVLVSGGASKRYRTRPWFIIHGGLYRLSNHSISGYNFEFRWNDNEIGLMEDEFEVLPARKRAR